jgi:proline-specific peptidase
MRTRTLLALPAFIASLSACDNSSSQATDTTALAQVDATAPTASVLGPGEARLAVEGGHIWYKVSGSKTGVPVILVHGGPGFNSFYLKPLEALGDERPVVRYDQLGAGKSDGMTDTTKMNIPHFVAELDSLRAYLGYDKVHIVGHSWGTMLAMEYYRAHPEHVVSLSLGGPVMNVPEYAAHAKALVKTLSDSAQQAIREGEASGKFDAPSYQHAMEEFYGKYVWLRPIPADLDSTMKMVNQTIYNYMQGPSEFTINGTFKDYDATSFLPRVKVPTLFAVGDVDEVGPAVAKRHAALTPGATYLLIPNSAHISTWDNPEVLLQGIRTHLKKADPK